MCYGRETTLNWAVLSHQPRKKETTRRWSLSSEGQALKVVQPFWTAAAASRITPMTTSGWESIGTWLLATSVTLAPMRFETQRCRSGWTVWSPVASKYQLGLLRQATWSAVSIGALKRSLFGGKGVAHTSFCSSSGRSPAKNSGPEGSIQARLSATSTRLKMSDGYLLSWSFTVSPASGATAAM